MMSQVDYSTSAGVWCQDKWKGKFQVKWIYVKDVPNDALRHITLENNENKPVTNSRDTQEVPFEKGKKVLAIIHNFSHQTSIFDDFLHYEKKQEEELTNKPDTPPPPPHNYGRPGKQHVYQDPREHRNDFRNDFRNERGAGEYRDFRNNRNDYRDHDSSRNDRPQYHRDYHQPLPMNRGGDKPEYRPNNRDFRNDYRSNDRSAPPQNQSWRN